MASIGDYEGYMEITEELEIEMPDDLEIPEEVPTVPGETTDTGSSGFGTGGSDDNDKKDDEPDKK